MPESQEKKNADAVAQLFCILSSDGAEQFEALCLSEGLLWRCKCGANSHDGESCVECGGEQPPAKRA